MTKGSPHIHQSLKPHAVGMIILLSIQYLLGEFTNLFVQFPERQHARQLWEFAGTQIPLVLHIIVGFLLLFGTISLLIRALVQKDKIWSFSATITVIVILEAVLAGVVFIPTQKDVYSFIMAVNFLIALFSLFWGLYRSK